MSRFLLVDEIDNLYHQPVHSVHIKSVNPSRLNRYKKQIKSLKDRIKRSHINVPSNILLNKRIPWDIVQDIQRYYNKTEHLIEHIIETYGNNVRLYNSWIDQFNQHLSEHYNFRFTRVLSAADGKAAIVYAFSKIPQKELVSLGL